MTLTEVALALGLAVSPQQAYIDEAARTMGVSSTMLTAIVRHEGGKTCLVKKNSDGSYDVGRAQINTIHSEELKRKYNIRMIDVACDDRLNALVAAWHLSNKTKEVNGDIVKGAGRYHSKTPKYAQPYLSKIMPLYQKEKQKLESLKRNLVAKRSLAKR